MSIVRLLSAQPWGLSTHFTTAAIPGITQQLQNPWDLQPGDALNKPGSHVMLFLRFTPDRKAEVMESSTGGCNGKVCRNVYPLSSLLARGYRLFVIVYWKMRLSRTPGTPARWRNKTRQSRTRKQKARGKASITTAGEAAEHSPRNHRNQRYHKKHPSSE
ncbi:MAG: hypothetical protein WDN50_10380 [Bradyrhizobium sp.]